MDEIRIVVRMGEVLVSKDVGLNGRVEVEG